MFLRNHGFPLFTTATGRARKALWVVVAAAVVVVGKFESWKGVSMGSKERLASEVTATRPPHLYILPECHLG